MFIDLSAVLFHLLFEANFSFNGSNLARLASSWRKYSSLVRPAVLLAAQHRGQPRRIPILSSCINALQSARAVRA